MVEKLTDCKLFRDVDALSINELCERYGAQKAFARGDVVATQGSRCGSLMILSEGQLTAETADRREYKLAAETLLAPVLVAPGCLFAENPQLPATLTARTPATVIFIPREAFLEILGSNPRILRNFLEILSSGGRFVSESTLYLACKTIKGKIARYLLDRAAKEGSNSLRNPLTQQDMAALFGVTRPALARALGELSAEGTIYVKGKHIEILFSEKLKQYIK